MTTFGRLHDLLQDVWDERDARRARLRIVLAAGTTRIPLRLVGYDRERNEVVLNIEEKS